MTVETTEIVGDRTTLTNFLSKTHREELNKILAIGEKYKKEGEEMKNRFWKEHNREEFLSLTKGYKESEDRFMEGLEPEEKGSINRLNEIEKKKFLNEYLKGRILYSGDLENENKKSEYTGLKQIKKWFIKRKKKEVVSYDIEKYLNKGGIEKFVKEWKDSLQPGINIDLRENKIGNEGIKILFKERKSSIQPGMKINFNTDKIEDETVDVIMDSVLKEGVIINIGYGIISKQKAKELRKRVQSYKKNGINCEIDIGSGATKTIF